MTPEPAGPSDARPGRPARPLGGLALGAVAVAGVLAVVLAPLWPVTHVPLVDLPFHAAFTSVFAHHADPAWGFTGQFELDPLGVPQVSLYALGALLSTVMPLPLAMKGVVALALLCLPLGLAALGGALAAGPRGGADLPGAGPSALGGVLAVGLVWSPLTHWGFVSFVAALGLSAVTLALALGAARTGRRGLGWAALGAFLAVFATHPSRAPFALAALGLAAVLAVPPRAGLRALGAPLAVAAALLAAWWLRRPAALAPPLELGFEPGRLRDVRDLLFLGFEPRLPAGAREQRLALEHGVALALLVLLGGASRWRRATPRAGPAPAPAPPATPPWHPGRAVLALALLHLAAFVTLPMKAGDWWYVFPRELPAALYFGLALIPIPSGRAGRWLFVALPLLAAGRMSALVAGEFRRFEAVNADFRALLPHIPPRPRLLYLVFDRRGTDQARSPFLHFPAWVQAERGGSLSFHFAAWGFYPVRYRADGAAPPPEARLSEFEPQHFRVGGQGPYWDTFLVRHSIDPEALFRADPTIRLAGREGLWWLYRRDPPADAAMRP